MTSISSLSLFSSLREPILRLQARIDTTQREISSGQRADVGIDLGAGAAAAFALTNQASANQALLDANKIVGTRLSVTQSALASIADAGGALQQQLAAASTGQVAAAALQQVAASTIGQLKSILGANVAGAFVFAGSNTSQNPGFDYSTNPPGAAKAAVDSAFVSTFGFAQSDPRVAAISPAAMQSFIDGPFSALFSDAGWRANWSSASAAPIESRIAEGSTVQSSITANNGAIRNLVQAAVMVADLGLQLSGQATQKIIIDAALSRSNSGASGVTEAQGQIGAVQKQIESSNSYLTAQTGFLQGRIDELTNIDPAAASVEMTTLSTQLQSAYSLTARISQLSILKYI